MLETAVMFPVVLAMQIPLVLEQKITASSVRLQLFSPVSTIILKSQTKENSLLVCVLEIVILVREYLFMKMGFASIA